MQRRGSERRRFVRVHDNLIASVEPTSLETYIEPGTELRVVLQLDEGDEQMAFQARVVRCRTQSDHSHEIAAEFVGGSIGDHRRLQDEISRRVGREPVPPAPPMTA
jgi:hypothetical protein